MKRERDTAVRAIARFTTIAAEQRRGKPAPIQKQNRLLSFVETIGNGLRQFFRKNSGFLFPSPFLPEVNDAHKRHLVLIYALSECE